MRSLLVAWALACAAGYSVQDVKKHATALFVHVESELAERAHANRPVQHNFTEPSSSLSTENPHKKARSDVAETGMLRPPTQQEMQAAHKRAGEQASEERDPELKAAALIRQQMILSAQEKAGVRQEDQQQQRAQVLAGSCPLCGHNKYGTVNCCSKGGTWEGKCTNDLRDGGEHTWIEGFNACKEPIP